MPDTDTTKKTSNSNDSKKEANQTGQANVKFRDFGANAGTQGDNKKNKNKNKGGDGSSTK